MYKLVLVRHGESTWNLENRFTGWTDVDLTETGIAQAKNAGRLLKAEGFDFDVAYTSMLKRATRTLWHVLDEMDRTWLPVVHSWRLNERHYGGLQGLNKADMAKQYGDAQVLVWQDMAGLTPGKPPKFVKQYADLRSVLTAAVKDWAGEVVSGAYPGPEHEYH